MLRSADILSAVPGHPARFFTRLLPQAILYQALYFGAVIGLPPISALLMAPV
jgi:hypothetical protein